MIDYLLFLPFFSTLMIVINVYNGDITGLDNNIEYILWYIPIKKNFFMMFWTTFLII